MPLLLLIIAAAAACVGGVVGLVGARRATGSRASRMREASQRTLTEAARLAEERRREVESARGRGRAANRSRGTCAA